MENIVSLKDLVVEFEDGERILKSISLDIKDKEEQQAENVATLLQ